MGGVLLVVGDHTDLFGMNRRLNGVIEDSGIELLGDSSSDARTGGFNFWTHEQQAVAHPCTAGLERLLLMTPCTIKLSGSASPILWLNGQTSEPGDEVNRSGFGGFRNDLRTSLGPKVYVAEGRIGDGLVVAFSDNTCWPSFALHDQGRDVLLHNIVDYMLGRRWTSVRWHGYRVLALAAVFLGWLVFMRGRASIVSAALSGIAAVGFVGLGLRAEAKPKLPPPTLTIDRRNCGAVFPSPIGQNMSGKLDRCYDTFLTLLLRCGMPPRMLWSVRGADLGLAHMIVDPVRPIPKAYQAKLRDYVQGGGVLILVSRAAVANPNALATVLQPVDCALYLDDAGLSVQGFEASAQGPGKMVCWRKKFGQGSVLMLVGDEELARESLGHCFDRPVADQLASMRFVASMFDIPAMQPIHDRAATVEQRIHVR